MRLLARVDAARFRGADVVVAFPGPGLVGGIVAEELVETLNLTRVGSFGGTALPPQAVVENGRPSWPVVVFARDGLVVAKCDVDLDERRAHAFARAFTALLARAGARSLLVVDGLAGAATDGRAWGAAMDSALLRRLVDAGIPILEDATLGGASGACLLWADEAGLPAAVLATPARAELPDARAAARVVAALNRLLDLDVDADGLVSIGDELERAWRTLLEDIEGNPRGDAMFS